MDTNTMLFSSIVKHDLGNEDAVTSRWDK